MKIKNYIIVALIIALSFFSYHLYAKKEADKTSKPCASIVEGYVSIDFSTGISDSTVAQKTWGNFQEGIESVVKKLNLTDITVNTTSFSVVQKPSQISAAEGNESKGDTFKLRGNLTYKSESAKSLSLLMDALNKKDVQDRRTLFTMSRHLECP